MDPSRRMSYQSHDGYGQTNYGAPSYPTDAYSQPWPRTSNTQSGQHTQPSPRKSDPMSTRVKSESSNHHHSSKNAVDALDEGMHATSDFVKKLFKMLEDPSFQRIVAWGPHGDCFVVKDMNEFTKSVLPRMFKHQNFASFVRQLNKYDFHKVKNADDASYGEQSWTFRHPDFNASRPEALDNIKRKVPAARKSTNTANASAAATSVPSSSRPTAASNGDADVLQQQIERLTTSQEEMSSHVRNLERNYHDVLVEMVGFQRNMAQQDVLMQDLIQYFLQSNRSGPSTPSASSSMPGARANPFLPQRETLRMVHPDAASASLQQMNEMSRLSSVGGFDWTPSESMSPQQQQQQQGNAQSRAATTSRIWAAAANAGLINPDGSVRAGPSSSQPPPSSMGEIKSLPEALQRIEELQRMRTGMASAMSINIPSVPPFPGSQPDTRSGSDSEDQDDIVMPNSGGDSEMVMPSRQEEIMQPQQPSPQNMQPQSSFLSQADQGFVWPEENASHEGLQVFTVGHLLPKDGNWGFDQPWDAPKQVTSPPSAGPSPPTNVSSPSGSAQKLTVRRSTFVPGWAVPPRVLLVDDDAVARKLSSKFLQVFGCTIDVAVDGMAAVNKMNLEKYDLVLMDIVMPKLDGVSATSIIRKFDPMTPIISMTSNSKPNEIMTYYSSGMNDVLPKPFTKQGLLNMLEKHLSGLHEIGRAATSIQRPLGAPGTDADELVSFGVAEDAGRVNPLAGMGLTDDQYNAILQNIVASGSDMFLDQPTEKRRLEDAGDERQVKRGRFDSLE